jgi:ketosteroid isomerase-like protein
MSDPDDSRWHRFLVVVLALALAAVACKREEAGGGPRPAERPVRSAGAGGGADAGVADTTEVAGDPEARARALIDAWLAAQNAGDFAAYRELYGDRFSGIRRSGAKVAKLDRTRWLAERKRMFDKPIVVRATDVEIARSDQGDHELTARFVQTWASGAYRDIGDKELWLDDRGDRLLIVREEMLSSRIVREPPPAGAVVAHPVIAIDALLLVGVGRAVDGATPSGPPRMLGRFQTNIGLFRPIDETVSPAASGGWTGRQLALYGERGPLCQIEVSTFGHAGIARGPDSWSAQRDGAKLAEQAWRLRSFRADVALALVEAPPDSCRGALYALPAGAAAPRYGHLVAVGRTLEKALLGALAADERWTDPVSERYALNVLDEEFGSREEVEARRAENPEPTDPAFMDENLEARGAGWKKEGPPEVALVTGAVYGDVGWVVRVGTGETLESLGDVCYGRATGVRAAADLDRDGALDLILSTTGQGSALVTQTGASALFYIEGNWSSLWWCSSDAFE